jgi:N-acyl homoserine lactone hydrolase
MIHRSLIAAAAIVSLSSPASAAAPASVRLYALDCGQIEFEDMAMFADTGELDGKPATLPDPCFVVVHPKGELLWDAGLGNSFVGKGTVEVEPGVRVTVARTLEEQLKQIALKTEDIDLVSFSHFHFDHIGNASAFTKATWLLSAAEYDAAIKNPRAEGPTPAQIQVQQNVKMERVVGDRDVFGDGTVRILSAPGHTPGHQVLVLKLAKSGTVMLSGDLYHTLDNRRFKRVPAFNVNRAETLASIDRFERIAENTKARVIVQHSKEDFDALPKVPAYLE